MKRASSLRRREAPMPASAISRASAVCTGAFMLGVSCVCLGSGRGLFLQLFGGVLHRLDDVLVAGAAAQVAAHAHADFGFARVGVLLQEAVGAHEHAGGAETALQTMLLVEDLLDRVQHALVGEALDGEHLTAIA